MNRFFEVQSSKSINKIAFEKLEKLKLSHSKVENVKHKMLKMRKN